MKIVAATGHRPNKIGGFSIPNPMYNAICQAMEKALIELKPDKAISGMALGIDTWFAEICLKLNIPFIAAVPFKGQENIWPQASKEKYWELLKKASEIIVVSEGGYSPHKMQIRNRWMVDNCNQLIAVWNQTPGGTGNCVEYAKSVDKSIYFINPNEL